MDAGTTPDDADDSRWSAFVHCVRASATRRPPSRRRSMIARGKALAEAGDCASCHTADPAKPFAGGKRIDTPFGGDLFAQPDAGPRHRHRRLERRRFLPRAALRRGARRLALLPGLPLSEFHEADARRHSGRSAPISATLAPVTQHAAAAGAALAAQLSRRDARLELAVLQARHPRCRTSRRARSGIAAAIWSRALGHCGACHTPKNMFGADKRGQRLWRRRGRRLCSRRGSMAPSAAG